MTVIHNPSTLTTANLRREIAADIDARLNQAANEASTGKRQIRFAISAAGRWRSCRSAPARSGLMGS